MYAYRRSGSDVPADPAAEEKDGCGMGCGICIRAGWNCLIGFGTCPSGVAEVEGNGGLITFIFDTDSPPLGLGSLAGEVSFVFAPLACPERFPSFLNMSARTVLLHPAS